MSKPKAWDDHIQAVVLTEQDGHDLYLHGVVLVPRGVNIHVAAEAIQAIRVRLIADNHKARGGEEDWTYDDIQEALQQAGYPCLHFLAVEEHQGWGISRGKPENYAAAAAIPAFLVPGPVDWAALTRQKSWLLRYGETCEEAAGLVGLLDAIQDAAVDRCDVPESTVFPTLDMENPNDP